MEPCMSYWISIAITPDTHPYPTETMKTPAPCIECDEGTLQALVEDLQEKLEDIADFKKRKEDVEAELVRKQPLKLQLLTCLFVHPQPPYLCPLGMGPVC